VGVFTLGFFPFLCPQYRFLELSLPPYVLELLLSLLPDALSLFWHFFGLKPTRWYVFFRKSPPRRGLPSFFFSPFPPAPSRSLGANPLSPVLPPEYLGRAGIDMSRFCKRTAFSRFFLSFFSGFSPLFLLSVPPLPPPS